MTNTSERTKEIARLGVMAALSVVLAALFHFPLFPSASYLEYDPADIPVLLTAFLYGPVAGVIITAVVSIVQGLTVSASGGVIGILMHFLATGCFCIAASLPYHRNKNTKTLCAGLGLGTLVMAGVMVLCNLVFTPLYTGMSVAAIASMVPTVILPFNLLKAGINAVFTFLLFRPLKKLFFEENS